MEAQFSKKFLLNRDFITLFFAQILACTAFQFISSLLVSYGTEDLGMDKVLVSTLSGIISLSALLFRPINSIVVDLFDRKGLFALSLLLLALSNLGVAFSEAYAWLYALQIIRGLAWAVLITSGYVLVGEIVGPSSLHTATAVFTMGQTIANVFTASLALAIVNKAGFRVAFIVGGICALFAMLLVLTIKGNHSAEDKVEKSVSHSRSENFIFTTLSVWLPSPCV